MYINFVDSKMKLKKKKPKGFRLHLWKHKFIQKWTIWFLYNTHTYNIRIYKLCTERREPVLYIFVFT
jgi:hypothetical protein